ncbi:MAG: Prevent-host-death protein [Magnetococcales bacterium]|nr:Prevent-host-death protein [Magnetococcales bacterium]HIJ82847.1 type II toxin-antitoxin system Phd/YefM family antitoxin [Magnetococcales bacterium]
MSQTQWSLQDAKNRFSRVVKAAQQGYPQTVTKRGIPAVVVIATEEYERLQCLEKRHLPSFIDHLLAIPKDDESFESSIIQPRNLIL